ncbi:M20 family metallopeptidase [Mycobacterium sp. 21AC1]|uniref:M20 metallopeptidase family protein n=1 Tax=[Mycobacterium] appelbergii TaxID=2939269 RepID=UPI00293933BA|nr:M20 family metallopeptidase [Mycobacterium sp. 21AC1]MDV3123474.1 M20 family metallopeptidase [Mycobacterium sp. 21AC1]
MGATSDANGLAGRLIALRRRLHCRPELGLALPETQAQVLAAIGHLPLEITTGTSLTSITAVIRGRPAPHAVLLRADMDALPVDEATDLPYASQVRNAMHGCGHDLHTAMLVGAAELLCARRDALYGDVVLMFQPGEEGWEGAQAMLDEGVLDAAGKPIAAAYALHVFSNQPAGAVRTRSGAVLAASAELDVRVVGTGGHASAPHLAHDPVPAAAEMILALQRAAGRDIDAQDPAVVTVGVVEAGERPNVIPESARFVANIRTFSAAAQQRVEHLAERVLNGIAAAHGVRVEATFSPLRPATINDETETDLAVDVATDVFGIHRVTRSVGPENGSEDFSRVLAHVPGCFISLGAMPAGMDAGTAAYNHSPHALFDDGVLIDGAKLLAAIAIRRLQNCLPVSKGEAS